VNVLPKIKTHRGAAKRFKKTGTGKFRARHAYHSHILEEKTAKRKRRLRKGFILDPSDVRRIRALVPYC
jgi:large subunit ribosomal protein L35